MKLIFYKSVGSFLAILGLVIGFSTKVIAQYGAPPSNFRINGKITSKECNQPINKIQIVVKTDMRERVDTLYTNIKGEYKARLYFWNEYSDEAHSFSITTIDQDDSANGGKFASEEKNFEIKANQTLELDIKLKHLDIPPCSNDQINPPIHQIEPVLPTTNSSLPLLKPEKVDTKINDNEFTLYPNPIKTHFSIEFKSKIAINTTISIFNDVGSLVFVQHFNSLVGSQRVTVNSLNLAPGNYIVSLTQEAWIITKKIIII